MLTWFPCFGLWTSQKIKRHCNTLSVGHPHAKCEVHTRFLPWDIKLTRFLVRTLVTPQVPLTSTKYCRDDMLSMGYPPAKYELHTHFSSRGITLTRFLQFDLWWPLNSTKTTAIIYWTLSICMPQGPQCYLPYFEIFGYRQLSRFQLIHLWRPRMTLALTYKVWYELKVSSFDMLCVKKFAMFWPLMTSSDLWPPPKQ